MYARGRDAKAVVTSIMIAGLVGIGLLTVASAGDSDTAERSPTAFDSIVPGVSDAGVIASVAADEPALAAAAATPEAAVRVFLDAEARGDLAGSFAALSAKTRATLGPLGAWRADAAERPHYIAYELTAGTGPDEVRTTVSLQAQLDEVSGLVPSQAVIDWATVAEDGGWRVDLEESAVTPVFPNDSHAPEAAVAWAEARQQCRSEREYDGSLLLSPSAAETLCGSTAAVTADSPAPLDTLADSSPVVAAFGPDAADWARVVRIHGPADLAVVTAPLGDDWVVVGVASG